MSTSSKLGRHMSCRHFIGQVAQPSEIIDTNIPIDIECLYSGEPVWVKRTDHSWTYAVVKKRKEVPNPSVVVMVSIEGATKTFSAKRCPMFLRKVMDDHTSESDVDISMSNSHSCSKKAMDNSVHSFLASVELFCSQRSMQHHAESIKRLAGLSFSNHVQQEANSLHNTQLPMPNSCHASSMLQPPTPRCRVQSDAKQSTRHDTFKPLYDQSLNSSTQEAKRIPIHIMKSPPVARRTSWSVEIKNMSEGLLEIPKKRLDDLGLGDMIPLRHGNTDVSSFHQNPKSNHGLLSEIPPLPFGKEDKEKTGYLDENVSTPRKELHNAEFKSFQHALKSIHRRSSVFLPPVSGSGVTLH